MYIWGHERFKEQFVMAALLIDHGVDVNAQDRDGKCPLMTVVSGGRSATALQLGNLILCSGTNVDAQSQEDATALVLVAFNSRLQTPLEFASPLLDHGRADVDVQGDLGVNALMYACICNRQEPLEMVDLLVKHVADSSPETESRDTALGFAVDSEGMTAFLRHSL